LLIEKLGEDGFPIFKKLGQVKSLIDTVFIPLGLIDYYGDLMSDCSKLESERDTLFAVKVIETIFNNVSLFGDVALTDAIEYVARIFESESRSIAINNYFDAVLEFEHEEWFDAPYRELEVTVEALYYFAGFQGDDRGEFYYDGESMVPSNPRGDADRIVKHFTVNSNSNNHRLSSMRPGIYLLTARDSTDGTIRRKMLTIDRVTWRSNFEKYKVGFNYKRDVEDTTGLECQNLR